MINFSELKIKTLHHLASPLPLTLNNNLQYLVKVNKREIKTIGPYFVLVLLWLTLNWYFKDAYFVLVLLWLTLNRYFKGIFRTLNKILYSFARISLNFTNLADLEPAIEQTFFSIITIPILLYNKKLLTKKFKYQATFSIVGVDPITYVTVKKYFLTRQLQRFWRIPWEQTDL